MRTVTSVHSPQTRVKARLQGEWLASLCLIRTVAAVSLLRTLLTRVLPLCSNAGWWIGAACVLPGIAAFCLGLLLLRKTGTACLCDAMRAVLGKGGVWGFSILLTLLLTLDGASSMTALITFFTEGIGASGPRLHMALLTAGVLLFCLNREGLPRGMFLLRYGMIACALIIAVDAFFKAQPDALFPLLGEGWDSISAGLRAGGSAAWPLLLILSAPPPEERPRLRSALPAILPVLLSLILLRMLVPAGTLNNWSGLAASLAGPTFFLAPAVRTLAQCLLMLLLFLGVAGAAHLATVTLASPAGKPLKAMPYVLVILLTLSQMLDNARIWATLGMLEPWMLVPLLLLLLLALFLPRRRMPC